MMRKIFLSVMQDILTKYNYEITICSESKKVSSLLKEKSFDLIFLDIWMPENGWL